MMHEHRLVLTVDIKCNRGVLTLIKKTVTLLESIMF